MLARGRWRLQFLLDRLCEVARPILAVSGRRRTSGPCGPRDGRPRSAAPKIISRALIAGPERFEVPRKSGC